MTDADLSPLKEAFRLRAQFKSIRPRVPFLRRTMHFINNRYVFPFRRHTREESVSVSLENAWATLHLSFESENHLGLPLVDVLSVHFIHWTNGARYEADIHLDKTSPILWELDAVLDLREVQTMANEASAKHKRPKDDDTIFYMIITGLLAESNRVVELCYRISWKTIVCMTHMLGGLCRRLGSGIMARLPQLLRSAIEKVFRLKQNEHHKAMTLDCMGVRYAAKRCASVRSVLP